MRLFLLGLVGLLVAAWAWITQPLLPQGAVTSAAPVEPSRLEAHVRTLSETFFPREAGHPENLDKVARYVRREFERAGGEVSEQPYQVQDVTYRNVITLFGPRTTERIVVGAHYDSAGAQPGADDNASGVAGLIELAYLLGKTSSSLGIELVAFTLEEAPHFGGHQMGSAVHVASLKQQEISVRLMLSLEMIGYFTDAPRSQDYPLSFLAAFYPSQGNFIALVGKLDQILAVRRVKQAMRGASPLPVYSINAPRFVPGVDLSDHMNYWEAGYTAMMIPDTAFYRNTNYHSATDTADTLDYRRMAMVVQGVHAAVLAFAQ